MAKYLVTGGAGFIGSHLVDGLVAAGDKVVVFDNLSSGHKRNLQDHKISDVRLVEGDVRDDKAVKRAAKGCDYALHLAGLPGVERSVNNPDETLKTAFLGTLNVLSAARELKIKRVIYASSAAVYGHRHPAATDERHPVRPTGSTYGDTKIASEQVVLQAHAAGEIAVSILRPADVYGPGSQPWTILPVEILRLTGTATIGT